MALNLYHILFKRTLRQPLVTSRQQSSAGILASLPLTPPQPSSDIHSANSFIRALRKSLKKYSKCRFNHNNTTSMQTNEDMKLQDIEDLHSQAVRKQRKTYVDPNTGLTVFTEYAHLKRGRCCGNRCRHCPYGSKVRSGDKKAIEKIILRIEDPDTDWNPNNDAEPDDFTDESCSSSTTSTSSYASSFSKNIPQMVGVGTTKNVPYTRLGDKGVSSLSNGEKREKDSLVFEAMGTVDELCSVVGVVHAELRHGIDKDGKDYGTLPDCLLEVMSRLFDIGSHIAIPNECNKEKTIVEFSSTQTDNLEEWIDAFTDALPELTSFILPTGGRASAQLHQARCVCRRAERQVVTLEKSGSSHPNSLKYLNRLSDFLFTAARWTNHCEGMEEIQYKKAHDDSKQRKRFVVTMGEKDK